MNRLLALFFLLLLIVPVYAQDQGIPIPPGNEGADMDTLRSREEFRIGEIGRAHV